MDKRELLTKSVPVADCLGSLNNELVSFPVILFNSLWIVNITPFSQLLGEFSSVNVIRFDDDYTIIFPFHKSMEGVIHLRTIIIAIEKVFRHDCYCFLDL